MRARRAVAVAFGALVAVAAASAGAVAYFLGPAALDPTCRVHTTCDDPSDPSTCYVHFCADVFRMGDDGQFTDGDERPVHTVFVRPFALQQTEATVGQWRACVEAGACKAERHTDELCLPANGVPNKPINCIDWFQADQLCRFLGARLSTEAEWEYAARSGGTRDLYPWGNDQPDCTRTVINGCKSGFHAVKVCSHPSGNSAQGVCDLVGNVIEWNADHWHLTYDGAPHTSAPWDDPPTKWRNMRGGGLGSEESLHAINRIHHPPEFAYPGLGTRCAK